MAHLLADRVKETTTTTGTGTITLAGAASGFRAFSTVLAAGDTTLYCIELGTEWEVGVGTYNTTLARTTVLASSNAGALVNFSAGTKNVFITFTTAGPVGEMTGGITPTVISVGAEFTSAATPTATLPGTHAANDILVLVLQSSNQDLATPSGYTRLGPQNGIGASAVAASTRLGIFWKRDGGSESAPTLADSGDHTYGFMFAVRGCPTTGDPFHFVANSWKFTASTTGTAKGGETYRDNCLIASVFAHAVDNAGAQASAPTNADLSSVTEQFDDGTTDGTGGGLALVTGIKLVAGSFTNTTVTWANSTVDLSSTIAFIPANSIGKSARGPETQTFIGSLPNINDTWVKPSGARHAFVALCDGGGSGSGGNTTTTAAGGGGGGGGGYDEVIFLAGDLAATETVRAGAGGAAGTALNQAGNVGTISTFSTVNPTTKRITGTAATAAASADGGNGGCGSGAGVTSPAVATTRLSMEVTTDGVAYGKVGGRGGSGTTGATGGSPADWGGGGGESGADTDAAITSDNNGYSLRGGGGGSGGRTNTNISQSGHGGGAAGISSAQGAAGGDSTRLPYGGSGGVGGGSSVVLGGRGGFPGGGGGGGAGVAGGFGGAGGMGCIVVTTWF